MIVSIQKQVIMPNSQLQKSLLLVPHSLNVADSCTQKLSMLWNQVIKYMCVVWFLLMI